VLVSKAMELWSFVKRIGLLHKPVVTVGFMRLRANPVFNGIRCVCISFALDQVWSPIITLTMLCSVLHCMKGGRLLFSSVNLNLLSQSMQLCTLHVAPCVNRPQCPTIHQVIHIIGLPTQHSVLGVLMVWVLFIYT
jgi:hypothetical protein